MTGALWLGNRQHSCRVDLPLLRRIARFLLAQEFKCHDFALGVQLVDLPEMKALNERFLRHRRSTDVITFDYREHRRGERLHAEIFICLPEAQLQARRFGTSPSSELTRYLIHGLLHLHGYDDRQAKSRRQMKRQEARLLRELERQFPVQKLACARKRTPGKRSGR